MVLSENSGPVSSTLAFLRIMKQKRVHLNCADLESVQSL